MPPRIIILLTAALSVLAVATEYFPLRQDRMGPVGAVADSVIILSFLWAGAYAWIRRPDNRTGPLMMAVGALWGMSSMVFAKEVALAYTAGTMALAVFAAPLAHLLLAFPTGRLRSRGERWLVGAIYVHLTVQWWAMVTVFDPREHGCPECPDGLNLLLIWPNKGLYDLLWAVQSVLSAALALAVFAILAVRWWRATPPERRALNPVLGTGLAAAVAISVTAPMAFALPEGEGTVDTLNVIWAVFLGAVPIGFLAGLLRTRVTRTTLGALVSELRGPIPPLGLRGALARALGDPSVEIGFRVEAVGGWRDVEGRELQLPAPRDPRRTVTLIGGPVDAPTVLVHDRALLHDPGLLAAVADTASLALENERLHAEVRARLAEADAARARLVRAGDDARRRIERDLHDGAQQTLVTLVLTLRMMRDDLGAGETAAAEQLAAGAVELGDRALEELRDLARGVYPATLREEGLTAALRTLAAEASLPVHLQVAALDRAAPEYEAAAWFAACEAVVNAAKHAGATGVTIAAAADHGRLRLTVQDDGRGGAAATDGGGLAGLADRVGALGGDLTVTSPAGEGTCVSVRLPWPQDAGAADAAAPPPTAPARWG